MYDIGLISPSSLNDALETIHNRPGIKPIAGGTDIIHRLHKKEHIEQLKAHPIVTSEINDTTTFIDISNIEQLQRIEKKNGNIEIGACTTHSELISSPIINRYFPALVEAASQIGSPQIRNRATIGGNIMNASPAADTVPPLVVLQAIAVIASTQQTRELPIVQIFKAPGETYLTENELLITIKLPIIKSNGIQFYRRIAARKAHACAKASIAFHAKQENEKLSDVRIAFGAVGATVISSKKTAALMEGKKLSPQLIDEIVQTAANEVTPIDDLRSTKDYRQAMIAQLLKQELHKINSTK